MPLQVWAIASVKVLLISIALYSVDFALYRSPMQWITLLWSVPFLEQDIAAVFWLRCKSNCIVPPRMYLALAFGALTLFFIFMELPFSWRLMAFDAAMRLAVFASNRLHAGLWTTSDPLWAPKDVKDDDDDCSELCSICLQDLCHRATEGAPPKHKLATTQCGHVFHESCLAASIKYSEYCPNCRTHLFTGASKSLPTFSGGAMNDPSMLASIFGGFLAMLLMDPRNTKQAYRDCFS